MVILPGVTIGKHCVIGANSVVNAPVPDYSIAVGSPARVVKRRMIPRVVVGEKAKGDQSVLSV